MTTTLEVPLMQQTTEVPTCNAPGFQVKTVYGSLDVRIAGTYESYHMASTDDGNLKYGYCPIFQHHRDGEYVFAFPNAAVISATPIKPDPFITVEVGEPFAYVSLTLQGIYCFERETRRWKNDRFRLVRLDGAQAESNEDNRRG